MDNPNILTKKPDLIKRLSLEKWEKPLTLNSIEELSTWWNRIGQCSCSLCFYISSQLKGCASCPLSDKDGHCHKAWKTLCYSYNNDNNSFAPTLSVKEIHVLCQEMIEAIKAIPVSENKNS